jgi:hypothetical protein
VNRTDNVFIKVILRRVRLNQLCSRKAVSVTNSESASAALVIQRAMHMCRIILSSVVSPAPLYFAHDLTRYDFRKTKVWTLK